MPPQKVMPPPEFSPCFLSSLFFLFPLSPSPCPFLTKEKEERERIKRKEQGEESRKE
jgi:hypothetical protein